MEPTIQPNVAETTPAIPTTKKSKIVYVIIAIILLIIIAMLLLKSKVMAPVTTEVPVVLSAEDKQIDNEISNIITPDNENDLKQIDKEF